MSKLPSIYLSTEREAQLLDGLRMGKAAYEDCLKHNHQIFHFCSPLWRLGNDNPFSTHTWLFVPMLEREVDEAQALKWLPLAKSGKIIGVYCQTELGHGTNVAGIETTATFDEDTDEFVIHSPTLSSTKYWPGSLGYCSTHAVLFARLILKGEDLGVHAFMVQLRNMEDFKPLLGIELGGLGIKMGYNRADNGFAIFTHVRIPRTNMLMRNSRLTRDGEYTTVPSRQKLLFGGMLNGRLVIARHAAFQLAQACTITTRYSVVRQQGSGAKAEATGRSEKAIIAFATQHFRLLTLISKAFAILFASRACVPAHEEMLERQKKGTQGDLAYNHTLSCGLKSWSTQITADGTDEARKMAGGQGFVAISGLPDIVAAASAAATFEGENWVLWQQLASHLVKDSSETAAGLAYLKDYRMEVNHSPCPVHGNDLRSVETMLKIFEHRAARLIVAAAGLLAKSTADVGAGAAWNKHMMVLIRAARAHIEVFVLRSFADQISLIPNDPVKDVLTRLFFLFAFTTIVDPASKDAISFIEDGHLSLSQVDDMRQHVNTLLDELLPDVISLTDAWGFTDASLASAIGCYDGNAYERLLAWTRQLPMNVKARENGGVFVEGYEKYIAPFLEATKEK